MSAGDAAKSPRRSESGQRRRLLTRIEREFETVEDLISLADGAAPLRFTRVRDPDVVLNQICQQEEDRRHGIEPRRELRMPYWAQVWESAVALGRFVSARRERIDGANALDLGCGMGLAGMAMASLGARVTLVDIETAALLFAKLNTLPWRDRCHVRRCDWQRDDLRERFDLIVGADVLYETEQWLFVESFLRRHLSPDGVALIGEPGRPKAEAFPTWITARGWSLQTSNLPAGTRVINVYEVVRNP